MANDVTDITVSPPTSAVPPPTGARADADGHLVGVQRLKTKEVQLPSVVFQNICMMAPAAAVGFNMYLIGAANAAGTATGLAAVLGSILIMLMAYTITQYTKRLPSAGGFYNYISHGLGNKTGTWSGFMFFMYTCVMPGETIMVWAWLTQRLVNRYAGVNISWIFWAVLLGTVVSFLAYRGVKLSARIGIVTGSIEICIFLLLGIFCLIHPASPVNLAPFKPSGAPLGMGGVLGFGIVFVILCFTGFESSAPIAEEATHPTRNITRSIVISVCVGAVLYTFMAFVIVAGWGIHNWPAFVAGGPDSWTVLANRFWPLGWVFVYFAMTNSCLGCALASTNCGARVVYAMGRVGVLPALFGRVHSKYKTPSQTIMVMWCVTIVLAVGSGLIWGSLNGYGVLSTILTIGAIIIYVMANIALPVFVRKVDPAHFSVAKHVVIPGIAGLVMIYALYKLVWPVPNYPYNLPGYIAIAYVVVCFGWLYYVLRRKPEAVAKGQLLVALDED